MITYIINTSENKTFDCDQLFRLAGYNKIEWINCSLNKVKECVDFIKNKQGTIVFEQFRLAIIVDFYEFNRIRAPYGTLGYAKEEGVDFGVYLPYIEAYVNDNLVFELEKQEYHPVDCDIYYIQSGNYDYIERIDNLELQINQILSPVASSFVGKNLVTYNAVVDVYYNLAGEEVSEEKYLKTKKEVAELNEMLLLTCDKESRAEIVSKLQKKEDFLDTCQKKKELVRKCLEEEFYTSFSLYCTKTLSLEFNLNDFPYNIDVEGEGASQRLFFKAFNDRVGKTKKIRRHFYQTESGNSVAKAAFDNFALSLYLIRVYERESSILEEGELNIDAIDSGELKYLLVNAWNKIVVARNLAKENQSLYYSLKALSDNKIKSVEGKKVSYDEEVNIAKSTIGVKDKEIKKSIEKQYKLINSFGYNNEEYAQEEKEEFNKILVSYLVNRDKTREKDVTYRYEKLVRTDSLAKTNICPSEQEYQEAIAEKHDEISKYLGQTLQDEYVAVNYDAEKQKAEKCYKDYLIAKSVLSKNILFDIIFLLITVAIMVIPFVLIKKYSGYNYATIISIANCAIIFGAVFILSLALMLIPIIRRLNRAKYQMLDCYRTCLAKKKVFINKLKKRYDHDLIRVEEFSHDIRLITILHNANLQKEKNINNHRLALESIEDCLSGILNNLGIYPSVDESVNVDGEFNISAPVFSSENKIYKILSLDKIEDLIIKKSK